MRTTPSAHRGRHSRAERRKNLSEANRRLERSALRDALTGLANRSQLVVRLAAVDKVGLLAAALVFVDLDNFKDVNDTYGDAEGDELLRTAAARMRSCVRPGDLLARLGGDEFAVLLHGTDVAAAEDLAQRVVEAMNVPFTVGGQPSHVTASVGVAVGTVDTVNPHHLLRAADLAMYEAKARGKARFVRFEVAMSDALTVRTRTEGELRQAIERDELVLHYQPIMNLVSGEIDGVEALVRWQHRSAASSVPTSSYPWPNAPARSSHWARGSSARHAARARPGRRPGPASPWSSRSTSRPTSSTSRPSW